MMRALLPLVLPWVCLAEPCLPGEATCEGDVGDVATFLHHKHRRSTRSSGPAVPCSSSLSSATWQLRKRFDEVFVELYGAPVNKNGMSDTKMRDHWPDMTVQGSQRRTKALSELMAELDDAFADAGQPLYDRNAVSRMQMLVRERLRGESIPTSSDLPLALTMDLFPQDDPTPSQMPFYYYPGIYQALTAVREESPMSKPEGLAKFPAYLRQWSTFLEASQKAGVIPQQANFDHWYDAYTSPVDWSVWTKDPSLLEELRSSLEEFQAAIKGFAPLIPKAYGPGFERGYSALGAVGQEIFVWRLVGFGMNVTTEQAKQVAEESRADAEMMSRKVVELVSQAFGRSMTAADVLGLINDQSGPFYYQNMSWTDMTNNLTLVYNNILRGTRFAFTELHNCNTAVYPCEVSGAVLDMQRCGNSQFPAFILQTPAYDANGNCVNQQILELGQGLDCHENLTKGLACMDYMIPLMAASMIHEGLGHWLQETIFMPDACNVDLPVVDTFQEGWGLYSESLGEALGAYDNKTLWGKLSLAGMYMGRGLRQSRYFLEHDVNYGDMTRSEAVAEWNKYPFASPTLYVANAWDFINNTCQRSTYWPTAKLMLEQREVAQKTLSEKDTPFNLPVFNHFMGTLTDQLTGDMVGAATQSFIDCSVKENCFAK